MTFEEKLTQTIRFALKDSKQLDFGKVGFVAKDLMCGYVVKVWYRTIGDENTLIKKEVVTDEQYDWEKAGCTNAEEYRAYLNRSMWIPEFSAGLNL